ncbi:hypothetical protein DFH09DRAFT_1054877, partial [Mycena vulgaris]
MEMKTLMAHLIMTHDVSLADGVRPNDEWYAGIRVPNITAEVIFRRRKLWLNLYFICTRAMYHLFLFVYIS